jgi:hypothetical protein
VCSGALCAIVRELRSGLRVTVTGDLLVTNPKPSACRITLEFRYVLLSSCFNSSSESRNLSPSRWFRHLTNAKTRAAVCTRICNKGNRRISATGVGDVESGAFAWAR